MTMTAVFDASEELRASADTGRLAHFTVLTDMQAAEPVWRDLEAGHALMTPYQRFAIQDAWYRHVAAPDGVTPMIVVGYDRNHAPLMVLPLGVKNERGVRVARFFGGKHVTFNMPLYRRDYAADASKADLDRMLSHLRQDGEADLLALIRQPAQWAGIVNPMTRLSHQASTNDCPVMRMPPGMTPADRISNGFRRRLKGKERKLQALPGFGYRIAADAVAIDRVLNAFFKVKPLRMAEQSLPNVFAEPGIEAFIRDACHRTIEGGRAVELHALECDDEVIAMFAGVADGERFSMMFNTYTMSANAKHSPGLILMRNIIDHHAARGTTSFDLGIGSDDYKRLFCKDDEPIFDSYLPLSARGTMAATAMSSLTRIRRLVKHNPALKQAAMALRSSLSR